MAIDPQLPEAHVALGRNLGARFQYADAARESRQAVAAEPDNALGWDLGSWALAYKTPPDAVQAEKAAREAIRLNPALGYAQYHLGRALYLQGRYPEAMAAFDRCEELYGNPGGANLGRAQALEAQKSYPEAIATMLKRPVHKAGTDYYWLSSFYAGNSDKKNTLATLEESMELGFRDFAAIHAEPAFNNLRNDPQFQQLLQRYAK